MKFIQCAALFVIASLAIFAFSSQAGDRIPVRVVVIATFQVGSIVVKKLSSNWQTYGNQIPSPASLPALPKN